MWMFFFDIVFFLFTGSDTDMHSFSSTDGCSDKMANDRHKKYKKKSLLMLIFEKKLYQTANRKNYIRFSN